MVEFIDLNAQQRRLAIEISDRMANVLEHGQYILGPEVDDLEKQFCAYTNASHCINRSFTRSFILFFGFFVSA